MEEKKFCSNCGTALNGQEKYCGKCGKPIVLQQDDAKKNQSAVNVGKSSRNVWILIFIIAACVFIGFWLYTHTGQKLIVGTWWTLDEYGEETDIGYMFKEDGTIVAMDSGLVGQYEIGDGKIVVTYTDLWDYEKYTFDYKIRGDQLTLEMEGDYEPVELIKE